MKIFVAGSKSQYDEVMEIVKRIVNESEVNYVTPGDITAEHMVHSAFQKISECNLVIALQNPDGALEEDVSYKVEFAKWLKNQLYSSLKTTMFCRWPTLRTLVKI